MTVACLQFDPERGAVAANLDAAERLVGELVRQGGADLVVLPELFASGYFFASTDEARALAARALAQPDAESVQRLLDDFLTSHNRELAAMLGLRRSGDAAADAPAAD